MKKDIEVTEVIFRKYCNNQVFALFPYQIENGYGCCVNYMHIGQHCTADLGIINDTKLASPEEYKDLYDELENIGYNLKPIKRMNWEKYRKQYVKLKV